MEAQSSDAGRSSEDGGVSARRGSGTTRLCAGRSSQERSGVGPPRKRQDYTARRLPGPAGCRLSDGDQTPEALSELFQDWQRTQTQSSVTTLSGLSQRMDVRFCEGRNHRREARVRAADSGRFAVRAPPKRASGELCFLLTKTYMDAYSVRIGPPQPNNSFISPISLYPATIRIDKCLNACRCLEPAQLAP